LVEKLVIPEIVGIVDTPVIPNVPDAVIFVALTTPSVDVPDTEIVPDITAFVNVNVANVDVPDTESVPPIVLFCVIKQLPKHTVLPMVVDCINWLLFDDDNKPDNVVVPATTKVPPTVALFIAILTIL
jgi:hypothetical protein